MTKVEAAIRLHREITHSGVQLTANNKRSKQLGTLLGQIILDEKETEDTFSRVLMPAFYENVHYSMTV